MGIRSSSNIKIKRGVKPVEAVIVATVPKTMVMSPQQIHHQLGKLIRLGQPSDASQYPRVKEIFGEFKNRCVHLNQLLEEELIPQEKRAALVEMCSKIVKSYGQSVDFNSVSYYLTAGSPKGSYYFTIQKFQRDHGHTSYHMEQGKIHYPAGSGITLSLKRNEREKGSIDVYQDGTVRTDVETYSVFRLLYHAVEQLLQQLP